MATELYMSGRKKYHRAQSILWSNNPGTLVDGLYVPRGLEIGAYNDGEDSLSDEFLILSDHNRKSLNFSNTRIEKKERMINGRMRSYHIADKLNISMNWDNLPSRAYALRPDFDANGVSEYDGVTGLPNRQEASYTVDGGAGGNELLNWYNNHQGSFWMFLAYDNYRNFGDNDASYAHLNQYNEVIEVFFSSFNYDVVKRGQYFDLWNVTLSLEEA
jgi:hypothetical protein